MSSSLVAVNLIPVDFLLNKVTIYLINPIIKIVDLINLRFINKYD